VKKLFEYGPNTDLFQLTVALDALFAEVSAIKSSYSWNGYAMLCGAKEEKIGTSVERLHDDILSYRQMLEAFVENAEYFQDNSCVDKFLNGEITLVKAKAQKSMNVLKAKAQNSKDLEERRLLAEAVDDMKDSVNFYLAIVRDIVRHNRKLQTYLLKRGVNYLEKYDLADIN
jgi:hypothetical protein